MNEELKIVIKAVTEGAKKEIGKVRDELDKVQKEQQGLEEVKKEFAEIGKKAAVAVAGIAALTAAMSSLAQSATEAQKSQGKLNAAFANAGMSAEQAQTTYKNLFRFLGDADTATEAANLLAQLTNNEQELAEWTTALQGVYATFPDSLPVEALVESANETAKVGQITGNLADALNWVGVSEEAFNEQLAATNSEAEREALIRSTLLNLYGNAAALYERNNAAVIANNEAQANLNIELAKASVYLTPLLTAITNLSVRLLQVLAPAIQTVANILIVLVQWVTTAASAIASFFGMTNKTVSSTSQAVGGLGSSLGSVGNGVNKLGSGLSKATKEAEKLKKQTMGFDELNVVSSQSASSTGAGGGGIGAGSAGGFDVGSLGAGFSAAKKDLEEVEKRLQAVLVLAGIVGAAIAAWKIIDMITNPAISLGGVFSKIGGYALIIAGALVTIQAYSDAWANGINWGNMAAIIGGLAAVIGGIALAYGALAAQIAIVAAGVALIVLGFVDFINNGATLQNTILIIGGAIAVAVGLATAGLSVLVSAIVAAVAAVAAFTAAILLEKPAILSVEEAQENLTAAKQAAAEAETGYVNAVDAAESALKRLEEAEKAAGVTGEELYNQVQSGTLDYANMTDAQKEVYKAYLDNEQKQKDLEASTKALNEAKKAETLASYDNQLALAKESGNYEEFKKSVVAAFEAGELSADEARELIGKSMSEMSDDAQNTFMKDLPNSIKDGLNPSKYETTRKKIADWFSQAWKDCKNAFKDVGSWFASVGKKVGEALSGAFKEVINWILGKIESTVNAPFKMINKGIDILNKVPGINITKLSLISIPRLAKGGIVTSSTLANIGEAGKEAVLPLENNTEWMDKLAAKISGNNAPTKIALVLDGKELGYATINSINNITRQTGSLQLALI